MKKENKPRWRYIDDENVRHVWCCTNEDCDLDQDDVHIGPEAYADIGNPVCPECDCELTYMKTEILNG